MNNSKSRAWVHKLSAALMVAILLTAISPMQAYAHTGGIHKKITNEAARGEGYSEDAIEELVQGNLQVDEHKGTEPGTPDNPGANAHGLRSPGQSEEDARAGAEEFKFAQMNRAIEELLEGNLDDALDQLGKGTHTVQDELQHRFGVWRGFWSWWNLITYYGIWFYGSMAVHGVRDAWLGDDEKQKNVGATKGYLQEFEERFMDRCGGSGRNQVECKELLRRLKEWRR